MKKSLENATKLAFPKHKGHVKITVDACIISVGTFLNQIQNGECQYKGFFSRKLSEEKRRINTFEKELFGDLCVCETVTQSASCEKVDHIYRLKAHCWWV